ncbi:MAG TPA: cation acetate symporter [Propioniciclava sp.]|jgi:cation/acetate symporter|uniref:solute symporter family protein n=1 Tax=Propioniciclava sp. TaxID=2038686 RepID=UPI002BAFBB6D|nr:cation acetate symporter [Propioniciclava sp.]HRL48766.1 cation acetate symporter [Propioniciclava sp.]HRL81617.1 cation acetate symporter [Propioniciclava sp.]
MTLLETTQYGNPLINILVFGFFVAGTLGIVIAVTRQKSKASDFYTGGAAFSGRQNGLAITGDYLSAAAFLGVTGAIALYGYDGLLYSVGFFVAWIVALYLVAEPLRNTGHYTMADVLSFRMEQKPVRTAAATSTLAISFLYLLAQMAGAGGLVALLLGVSDRTMQSVVIALVGVLMVVYVLIGGMKGTTWVQMIKAVLLVGGAAIMAFLVLMGSGFNLSTLLSSAQAAALDPATGNGRDLLVPMQQYGATDFTKLSFLSLSIALVAGPSGLPHVLMRFYTVPTAKEARRSAAWAIGLVGAFFLITLVLGMGAAKLVGQQAIVAAPGGANAAAPLLALVLGGEIFMGVISGVAFATILAVVAGLTITASASFAHDVYNSIIKDGKADPEQEVKVARITSVVIGVLAILGGIVANGQNIAFLISLAFAVAASANLPSILYTMYWKRFTTRGSVWSIYTGLISSVVLIVFSPAISGSKTAMLGEAVNFAWFPLTNPALVSVPLAFLAGWLGTITSPVRGDEEMATEMEVRSMTGAGAGEAIAH